MLQIDAASTLSFAELAGRHECQGPVPGTTGVNPF